MNLTAHILIQNFFLTSVCSKNPEILGSPIAVLKNNRVIDSSPELLSPGFIGSTKNQALKTYPKLKFAEIKDEIITYRQELASQCYSLGPRVETISPNEVFADLSGSKTPKLRIFQSLVNNLVPN